MEFLNKYKKALIGVGVLVLVFGVYFWWKGGSSTYDEGSLSTLSIVSGFGSSLSPEASVAGQEILSILNELKQINLDGGVFESAVFKSLVDYTIATTSEPIGRPDPFEPLPFERSLEEN